MMMSLFHAVSQGARLMGFALLSLWLFDLFGSQDPLLDLLHPGDRRGRRIENDVYFYDLSLETVYFTFGYHPVI